MTEGALSKPPLEGRFYPLRDPYIPLPELPRIEDTGKFFILELEFRVRRSQCGPSTGSGSAPLRIRGSDSWVVRNGNLHGPGSRQRLAGNTRSGE